VATSDGFHHPAGEAELVELVKAAHREGRHLRVRGAAHSVSHAIYSETAGENRVNQQEPPPGDGIDVMLDRYRGWQVRDEGRKLVEAQAGIHLGADPSSSSPLDQSLLAQLATEKRWTIDLTGGITHQTISGFTGTGSSGGSSQFSANNNLFGFRLIDGRGDVHELTRDDPEFFSMAPNLGLLGVVSAITLECSDLFAIEGSEVVTSIGDCPADLFGDGAGGRPSLEGLLRDTEFVRLEWWPQRGSERIVTWRASRIPASPDFRPNPYKRFGSCPEAAQQVIAIVFTILGNLDDLSKAAPKLEDNFDQLERVLEALPPALELGVAGALLAEFLRRAVQSGVGDAIKALEPLAPVLRDTAPDFVPKLIDTFIPTGEPQSFSDFSWSGLPMDNGVDDKLLPTAFTEPWLPISRTREVMELLRGYFTGPKDKYVAYRRTGTYAWELYSATPNSFWLSPAYSAGDDEWSDGVFRVDPYWFADNAGSPAELLYPGFWALLRDNGIPFRLHWGKFQPIYGRGDREWVDFFRSQYPRWDDFLALRAQRDPNNIFLTDYWRERFGLWDEPEPSPQT
jgi:D-arabinono-1,4-lactone oxidase